MRREQSPSVTRRIRTAPAARRQGAVAKQSSASGGLPRTSSNPAAKADEAAGKSDGGAPADTAPSSDERHCDEADSADIVNHHTQEANSEYLVERALLWVPEDVVSAAIARTGTSRKLCSSLFFDNRGSPSVRAREARRYAD